MAAAEQLITENLDIWASAVQAKSAAGRGNANKLELYGIKKLRELILELAVRGLLVPQDPNDEPASELLKKITVEKAQLVKDKKIKKPKALPAIEGNKKPFDLPQGWVWVSLGDVGYTQTGGTPKKADTHHYGQFMPFIKPGDIDEGRVLSYLNDGLSEEGAQSLDRVAPEDSVLMVCIGTIGKCARVDRNVAFNQQINSVTPYVRIGDYLLRALQAQYFQTLAWEASSSTTLSILNKGKWEKLPVPLAPIAEQARIVAKVDELMVLCDQLEQQQETSITAHQTLVQTLLDALTTASDRDGFTTAWARVADHFDTLFSTEWSIDQLKQTILQLAVMGKLVPQDPSDEPASELLKKIAAEKAQLVKDGKIKKQKALPAIGDVEKPFELPDGWELVRFGNLINLVSGQHLKPAEYSETFEEDMIPYLTGPAEFGEKYPEATRYTLERRAMANTGDLLITCKGSGVGKLNEANQRIFISRQLMAIQPIVISSNFLMLLAKSLNEHLRANIVGIAIPGISREDVTDAVIWLPPESEQTRIFAKVDELMALCDTLKGNIIAAQTTQLHLADVMADRAVA